MQNDTGTNQALDWDESVLGPGPDATLPEKKPVNRRKLILIIIVAIALALISVVVILVIRYLTPSQPISVDLSTSKDVSYTSTGEYTRMIVGDKTRITGINTARDCKYDKDIIKIDGEYIVAFGSGVTILSCSVTGKAIASEINIEVVSK